MATGISNVTLTHYAATTHAALGIARFSFLTRASNQMRDKSAVRRIENESALERDATSPDLRATPSRRERRPLTWRPDTLARQIGPGRLSDAIDLMRGLAEAANAPAPMAQTRFSERVDAPIKHPLQPFARGRDGEASAKLTRIRGLFSQDRVALHLIDHVILGNEPPSVVARSAAVLHIGWASEERLNTYVNGTLRNVLSIIADQFGLPRDRYV